MTLEISRPKIPETLTIPDAKRVGMVSLGCPKALVDSERILTRLRADGYASLHLGLPQYDRRAVDGLIVPADEMSQLCQRLALLSPEERCQQPCIGRERADLVVAGCAIQIGRAHV